MRAVVVTGASTGIGWGTTKILCENGFRVFGSVRGEADAERLANEFGDRFSPLMFDVTDTDAVEQAARKVEDALAGATLAGLVNNAGVAVGGPLAHLPIDQLRAQIEVNLIAVVAVTQTFLPLLGMDRKRTGAPGRIVNISSVAGKFGAPFVGAYVASKHGLEGLSESLRRELMLYGIDVIIVGPGAVVTPIWDKAADADLAPYEKTDYAGALRAARDYMTELGKSGYPPETVGRVVLTALTARKPKYRYAPVHGRFLNWILPQFIPRRMADRIYAKRLGFTK
jgi:NAD(P)-dependent dehydrogenase (short-subunit alcohol dehydrogenase family)